MLKYFRPKLTGAASEGHICQCELICGAVVCLLISTTAASALEQTSLDLMGLWRELKVVPMTRARDCCGIEIMSTIYGVCSGVCTFGMLIPLKFKF